MNEWFLSYKPEQSKNPLEVEKNGKKKKSNKGKNKNKNKKTQKPFFDFYGKKTRKNKKDLY